MYMYQSAQFTEMSNTKCYFKLPVNHLRLKFVTFKPIQVNSYFFIKSDTNLDHFLQSTRCNELQCKY